MIEEHTESVRIDDHGTEYVHVVHFLSCESFNICPFLVESIFFHK